MLRHYIKYKNGELIDEESGLQHLSHMAWNALAVLQLDIERPEPVPVRINFTPSGFIET